MRILKKKNWVRSSFINQASFIIPCLSQGVNFKIQTSLLIVYVNIDSQVMCRHTFFIRNSRDKKTRWWYSFFSLSRENNHLWLTFQDWEFGHFLFSLNRTGCYFCMDIAGKYRRMEDLCLHGLKKLDLCFITSLNSRSWLFFDTLVSLWKAQLTVFIRLHQMTHRFVLMSHSIS